jgi:predicted Zn-dependent protease
MKRLSVLALILLTCGAALYMAQRRKTADAVNANAVVDAAADLQRDITRVPMRITRLSDRDEVRIGDQLVERYGYADPYADAKMASIEDYVGQVGLRVAAHAQRGIDFHFHLLPDPSLINAFAVPGGHVFIGWGLLKEIKSEDELAFVLGHEIEHIDHYHAVERVQIEAQLHKMDLDVFGAVAQIPLSLWQARYSKDEEFEADREGLRLASAAGYSPRGAIDLLNRFLRWDREYIAHSDAPAEALSQLAIDGLAGYFRSHPQSSERLAQVKKIIEHDHLAADQPTTPISTNTAVETGTQ